MSKEEEKEIIIRSEEVNEILSAVPKWIYRWGTGIVFMLILIAIILSNFIKYPDIISGQVTVTTLNPPVKLIAKSEGKLQQLLVTNNQSIIKNSVLAVIENSANYLDILYLENLSDSILTKINKLDSLKDLKLSDNIVLGDVTPLYLNFLKSYKDLKLYLELSPQKKELALLNRQLAEYNLLLSKYEKQDKIYSEEFSLIEKDHERMLSLYQNKAISTSEFEGKKREYLAAQRNAESQKIQVSNAKITINNLEKNQLQLKIQEFEQLNKYKQDFMQSLKAMQNQIELWKQTYLLQSPIDGKVSFFSIWAENQNIKPGDEVFNVVPTHKLEFVGKVIIPIQNSGKVKIGQMVNIKLDSYPHQEHGIVEGSVKNISVVSSNNHYLIDVAIKKGLETSYHKTLPYKEEMVGSVDIITEKLTILQRIFIQFRKITERK